MDHLTHLEPSPRAPRKFPLVYRARVFWDGGDFDTFFSRASGGGDEGREFDPAVVGSQFEGSDFDAHADVLQAWLFFGLLDSFSAVFRVPMFLYDFIEIDEEGEEVVTTKELTRYLWYWLASEAHLPKGERFDRLTSLQGVLDKASRVVELLVWREPEEGHLVLVPICLLCDVLQCLFYKISSYFGYNAVLTVSKINPVPGTLTTWMEEKGWCEGEMDFITWRGFTSSSFALLASREKYQDSRDHSKCERSIRCVANQIENTTYETQHVNEDCECSFEPSDEDLLRKISHIVERDGIPVIFVQGRTDGCAEVLIGDARDANDTLSRNFVAISHVWSDGMGNAKTNTLPTCVLRDLKRRVERMDPLSDERVPFWVDTVCIPPEGRLRKKAIANMSHVYTLARATLVIDKRLQALKITNFFDVALLTSICPWTSRLWTLQETRLANDTHVDVSDGSVDILDLLVSWGRAKNPFQVTGSLFVQAREEHLHLVARIDRVFQLSSKFDDPETQEGLHHLVVNTEWPSRPLSSDSDELFIEDERLADFMIESEFLDPVHSAVQDCLHGLLPLDDVDSQRCMTVLAALSGRSTSRLADETICIATLLQLDPRPLLEISINDDRMRMLLKMIKIVPSAIVFLPIPRIPRQTSVEGFGWAPCSFLLGGQPISESYLFGEVDGDGGLSISFPGVMLVPFDEPNMPTDGSDVAFVLRDSDGSSTMGLRVNTETGFDHHAGSFNSETGSFHSEAGATSSKWLDLPFMSEDRQFALIVPDDEALDGPQGSGAVVEFRKDHQGNTPGHTAYYHWPVWFWSTEREKIAQEGIICIGTASRFEETQFRII